MWNEWFVQWAVAAVICTAYGWIQYRRGSTSGSTETAEFIVRSLVEYKVCTAQQVSDATNKWYNKVMSRGVEDEDS